jgi:hypothetical protein
VVNIYKNIDKLHLDKENDFAYRVAWNNWYKQIFGIEEDNGHYKYLRLGWL